ncbi:uncharacterized protein [Littorina saxatilis]
MKTLFFVCVFLVFKRCRGEVDYGACLRPCMSTFQEAALKATSSQEMCSVSTTAVSCLTSNCQMQERNIPSIFFTYLQQLYKSTGFSCARYATTPDFVPRGVDALIDALRGTFGILFTGCQGFEDCLVSEMTKMFDDRESDTCLVNHAMKYCTNERCTVVSQQSKDSLINVFFKAMEDRGLRCDIPGLHYLSNITTTTTTTTTTQQKYPSCHIGINHCDNYYGPATTAGCRVRQQYKDCVLEQCSLRKLPVFLLRKLEWEQTRKGTYHCDLVDTTGASTQSSTCLPLMTTLLTVLLVLVVL